MSDLSKSDWTRALALFDALVDMPESERETQLSRARDTASIIAQARELLFANDQVGVLDKKAVESPPTPYSSLEPGTDIGGFVIDRLIGRGGMGEVYEAHRQDRSFSQRVALKMLRPEAADQGSQFDRERRLLAGLEHPGIARLIDGGIAPDSRPYMAMEFVEGQPIDRYCASSGAGLHRRLELIEQACAILSFAHARLIIHRDIKPSNIMVDTEGRVRLLDFGIAKLLHDAAPQTIAITQPMATPAYASPEQLNNETATISADIYSLGAVLYELLTGKGPWQVGDNALPSLMLRIVRDTPPTPSQAAEPGNPVPKAQIRGDLDAIVMKALRDDPADRYGTITELADDIRRYLENRPVKARVGSNRYRLSRFVKRNRWAVAAASTAILSILLGAGGIAWQARQTAIQRDTALAEARRSESVNSMLTAMLRDTRTVNKAIRRRFARCWLKHRNGWLHRSMAAKNPRP